ncbi:hypothetical protein [Puia sp.]|jgi:hypothetical protein|uniref:hypothetical protein n=1 Tax=Puia sp. TaxID=2045100 RepID=UPI002F41CD0A
MQQFKITPESYKKFRRKWLIKLIPLIAGAITLFILINTRFSLNSDPRTFLLIVTVVVLYSGFNFFRALKKQKEAMLSYSITLTDSEITREQFQTPPLTISFMEVKDIVRMRKGNFRIRGREKTDVIHIPYFIEDYEELQRRLEVFAPVQTNVRDPFFVRFRWVTAVVGIAVLVGFYAAQNPIVSGTCGILVIGFLIRGFYEAQTNKNLPSSAKRRSWILLLVILAIAYTTWFKFTVF